MPLKASTRCQATGGPRGRPGVCSAREGHRPQPGGLETSPWDQAGPPSRDPRLKPCPHNTPELPGSARQARTPAWLQRPGRRLFAQPSTPATHGLTPSEKPRSQRAPQSAAPATPGADLKTGRPLRAPPPRPSPQPALHQRPGAAPPPRAAGGGRAAEGAPCSPGGHPVHPLQRPGIPEMWPLPG